MPRETFKDIFVVELQVCPHAIRVPGGLYKELDFLWLYLVNPGTLRKCMSTYALIVVTVISLLFSSSSIVAGIVSKKTISQRSWIKSKFTNEMVSKIIITIRNLQGTPTVTASFFLCLPLPQILYFYKLFLLSRVVGNNNLIQF